MPTSQRAGRGPPPLWQVLPPDELGLPGLGPRHRWASGSLARDDQREVQLEAGAGGVGRLGDDQVAALAAGELAGDVEAEAHAAAAPVALAVELVEALEDALPVGGVDARAAVLDRQYRVAVLARAGQAD